MNHFDWHGFLRNAAVGDRTSRGRFDERGKLRSTGQLRRYLIIREVSVRVVINISFFHFSTRLAWEDFTNSTSDSGHSVFSLLIRQ